MAPIRGLLLDMYGTLVHEDDISIARITAEVAAHAPAGTSTGDIGRLWTDVFWRWCAMSHGDAFRTERAIAQEALAETIATIGADIEPEPLLAQQFAHWVAPPIFPDTQPFLAALRARSIPVCIVSNVDRADLLHALALHDITADAVVTSDDVRAYKPRSEMFTAALATLGLNTSEVVHVGDSLRSDVAGASALGIPVAWLNRSRRPVPPDLHPTHDVANLTGLMEIIAAQRA